MALQGGTEQASEELILRGDHCRSVGQFSEAVGHYETYLRIATRNHNPMDQAIAYDNLGVCHLALGDCDKALDYHLNTLRIARKSDLEEGEVGAHCYLNLAICFEHRGDSQRAAKYSDISFEITNRIGGKKGAENHGSFDWLGRKYDDAGQCEKEIEYYKKALVLVKKLGDKAAEAGILSNLGIGFKRLERFSEAMEALQSGLSIAKELSGSNEDVKGVISVNLALCYYSLGYLDKALKTAETALYFAKQTGNKAVEFYGLRTLGWYYKEFGRFDKALCYHSKASEVAKQIGLKDGERIVRSDIGIIHRCLGQIREALKCHAYSLDIAAQTGDRGDECIAHGNLGQDYFGLGETHKALYHYVKALKIAQEMRDHTGEKMAHSTIGNCYCVLGQFEKAKEHHEASLEIARRIGDRAGEANSCAMFANYYLSSGQFDKAVECYDLALATAQRAGTHLDDRSFCRNLGLIHLKVQHQYDKADSFFRRSIEYTEEQFRSITWSDNLRVSFLDTFAETYRLLCLSHLLQGNEEEALVIAERGRAKALAALMFIRNRGIRRNADIRDAEALTLSEIRDVARELGSSVVFFSLVPTICVWTIQPNAEIIATHAPLEEVVAQLGAAYVPMDQAFDRRVQSLNDLIAKTMASLKSLGTMQCEDRSLSFLYQEGRDQTGPGLPGVSTPTPEPALPISGACSHGRPASEFMSFQEVSVPSTSPKPQASASAPADASAELGSSHGERPSPPDPTKGIPTVAASAGATKEAAKSNRPSEQDKSGGESELGVALKSLHQMTLEPVRHLIQGEQARIVPDGALALLLLQEDREQTEPGLPGTSTPTSGPALPRNRACSHGRPSSQYMSFQEVSVPLATPKPPASTSTPADASGELGSSQKGRRSPLDPTEGIPTEAAPEETTKGEEEFNRPSEQDESGGESELDAALRELYQMTLAPVRHLIQGAQAVIVPDGPLALLPFAALIDEQGRYVSESLQVRLVPSLTTAKMVARYPQGQGEPVAALIVGDPMVGEFVREDGDVVPVQRLPYANEEAQMIGKLLKVEPLTAEKATKAAFLQKVDAASLIHIAAHGDMATGEILFAPSPGLGRATTTADVMTMGDLEARRLRAQLVVLSSCHSGRGDVRADGVIGIARAFLGAGARAVLVTLWAVDDEATLFFMGTFYENLVAGVSVSGALHKAMAAMRESERFNNPCYWAAFLLIGDDVTLFAVK